MNETNNSNQVAQMSYQSKFANQIPEIRNWSPRPSDKQLAYITAMTKQQGVRLDMTKITTRESAFTAIEILKEAKISNRKTIREMSVANKSRAFEMATKLVYKKYCDKGWDPLKHERFWAEVRHFYNTFVYVQERHFALRDEANRSH